MKKYKIEWDNETYRWCIEGTWHEGGPFGQQYSYEFFDDLASAQEYKEKLEANDED